LSRSTGGFRVVTLATNVELVLWLRSEDLHGMFAIQYSADIYLVQESESAPDFFFERDAMWPFKYVSN
jgi:hypothetical protein